MQTVVMNPLAFLAMAGDPGLVRQPFTVVVFHHIDHLATSSAVLQISIGSRSNVRHGCPLCLLRNGLDTAETTGAQPSINTSPQTTDVNASSPQIKSFPYGEEIVFISFFRLTEQRLIGDRIVSKWATHRFERMKLALILWLFYRCL